MQCVTLCVKREIFVSDSVAAQRNVPVFKMETKRGRLAQIPAAPALTNMLTGLTAPLLDPLLINLLIAVSNNI